MQRTISFVLITLFLTSSVYSASSLKEALSTYSYSLEVEWDQKDTTSLNAYEDKLEKDLDQLMKIQSPTSLVEEALSLSTPSDREETRALVQDLSSGKIQIAEFQQKMLHLYNNSRMNGASWNGATKTAVGAVSVIAISYLVFRVYMHEWGKRL